MKTKVINKEKVKEIAECLHNGGVVAFPTDTVFGLGCIYDNETAIAHLKNAKLRPETKPLPMMVTNLEQLERVAFVDERVRRIAGEFMPGALTLVLKKRMVIPDFATNGKDTIAIRMPDDEFVLQLIASVGEPLLVTSANLSGNTSATSTDEVIAQLDGRIDLIVEGHSKDSVASTIIDATGEELCVLREGPLTLEQIMDVLN